MGPSAWHILAVGEQLRFRQRREAAAILGGDDGTGDPVGWRGSGAPGCEGTASLLPPLTRPEPVELVRLPPRFIVQLDNQSKILALQKAIAG